MNDMFWMEVIGKTIGYLFIFGWIPFIFYQTAVGVTGAILGLFTFRKHPSDDNKPKKDPIPRRQRKPKKLYTVDEGLLMMNIQLPQLKKLILEHKIRTYKEGNEVFLYGSDVHKLVPKAPKPSKSKYSILSDYSDEYKITNPVEFNT